MEIGCDHFGNVLKLRGHPRHGGLHLPVPRDTECNEVSCGTKHHFHGLWSTVRGIRIVGQEILF